MRKAALLFVASSSLWAQIPGAPATLNVIAPETTFIWGDTVKLQPLVLDQQGQTIPNASVSWSVQPASAATVAADGTVTPLQLASFLVTARAGAVSGQIYLQVIPKEIKVVADSPSMLVGATQHVHALALDINGVAIPNVQVQWQLTNELGAWDPRTPMAAIAADGTLKALIAGRLRIVASISYIAVPGFLRVAEGENSVLITPPETYRFERIYVAQPSSTATLFGTPGQVFMGEDGSVSFVASLNGTGSALVSWQNGETRTVLAEGRADAGTGQPLTQISALAFDAAGNWLVQETGISTQSQLSWGPTDALNPVMAPGSVFADAENSQSFTISRNSLNNQGEAVMIANYTQDGTHKSVTGLFSGAGSPGRFLIGNTVDGFPSFPGSAVSFTRAFGIADDGSVSFIASVDGISTLLRAAADGSVQKVLSAGDNSPIGIVSNVQSNGDATGLNFFVAPNGDIVAAIVAGASTAWLRWPGGDTSQAPQLLQTSTFGVYWHNPSVGTLVDTNYQGQGRGLYLWNDSVTPLLLQGDTSLDGSPVSTIVSASSNSTGMIVAMVQTANSRMLIVRLAPDRQVLVKAGDSLPVVAPPVLTAFVPGVRSGPPVLIAGGQAGSIVTLDDQQQLAPLVLLGTPLPGRNAYTGSNIGNSGFGQAHASATGQIFFADNSSGAFVWTAGSISAVLPNPPPAPISNLNPPLGFDVNSSGQLAGLFLSSLGWGIYMAQNGQLQLVATPTTNQVQTSPGSWAAIDGSGNIAFLSPGGPNSKVVLWDGQTLRNILSLGDTMPDGRKVSTTLWLLKSYDGGFIIPATMDDSQYVYLRYRNGSWEYLAQSNDILATGRRANYFTWQFTPNSRGDIVFMSSGGGYVDDIVALRNGKYCEVHSMGDLTRNGELLVAISGWHINDDGTIYILAVNNSGQQVVYRGTPLAN